MSFDIERVDIVAAVILQEETPGRFGCDRERVLGESGSREANQKSSSRMLHFVVGNLGSACQVDDYGWPKMACIVPKKWLCKPCVEQGAQYSGRAERIVHIRGYQTVIQDRICPQSRLSRIRLSEPVKRTKNQKKHSELVWIGFRYHNFLSMSQISVCYFSRL